MATTQDPGMSTSIWFEPYLEKGPLQNLRLYRYSSVDLSPVTYYSERHSSPSSCAKLNLFHSFKTLYLYLYNRHLKRTSCALRVGLGRSRLSVMDGSEPDHARWPWFHIVKVRNSLRHRPFYLNCMTQRCLFGGLYSRPNWACSVVGLLLIRPRIVLVSNIR